MPVGNEVFIAGQYTVTYDGAAVGIFEGDQGVPTLQKVDHAELIANTDAHGKARIDGIAQGSDWTFQGTCEEYKSGSKALFNPMGAMGSFGVVGRLYFDLTKALVMTAVTGTPAQTVGDPLTVSASKAILEPSFPVSLLFGPTLRKFGVRLMLLPYTGGGKIWFTAT